MKTNFLKFLLMAGLSLVLTWQTNAQCKKVGLIGEFTGWSADHEMTRDLDNPDVFTTIVNLKDDSNADGIIEVKFRVLGDWGTNWGAAAFPTGTGVANGANIPAPIGNYKVTFNCTTGEYKFEPTCGEISMIGEFIGWAGDHAMTRDAANPNLWTTMITFNKSSNQYGDSTIIEVKFRQDADWKVNWGGTTFPAGTGTQDGANILVPLGTYKVTFNCATGEYTFAQTCGEISLIGEFIGWAGDHAMTRSSTDPNEWSTMITFDATSNQYGDPNIIEMKFRQDADWKVNWGGTGFPTGTGTQDGPNIQVPLGTYKVTFNCSTGAYTFTATCGEVSMIGAFNGWNGDVEMNRSETDPNAWTLYRSWNLDSQVKFRQNKDWSVNWGNSGWPSGVATSNGPNIPLVAGKYDVTFNCSTGAYNFAVNNDYCGEIGLVGDFNEWGLENGEGFYTDALMKRDPLHPNNYTLTYTFTAETKLLFREDGDAGFTNVWGGTFPSGTGEKDASKFIIVPGGTFNITFNCLSGDFSFERLGSSLYAPKVFAINADGKLDEKDWKVTEPVSKLVEGTAGDDPNTVFLGAAYNDNNFYVALSAKDKVLGAGDKVEIALDGDKSGGDYDAYDIHFEISITGVKVLHGPAGYTPKGKLGLTSDGVSVEAEISWSALGVTPAVGGQVGLEIVNVDVDGTNSATYVWNGDGKSGPSSFGAVNLGTLSCGTISMYNDQIGDFTLRPTSNEDKTNTNTYVGTYEFESNMNVNFRKDYSSAVTWGNNAFPGGTATIGGAAIPATKGRYRVSFGCLDGVYSFTAAPTGTGVAYSQFAATSPVIDGNLTEYKLDYTMAAGVVAGAGPVNNEVKWGSSWDKDFVYFGAQVKDSKVEGAGNPWDNDAIEFYFDGNNDKDGTYDADYDTQIILDFKNGDVVWVKADGVKVKVADETGKSYGKWLATGTGYNVELKLPWADFGFAPARNKTMGFSIGNNDSDKGVGRDYQTAWFGTGNNWNDTKVLGDLQLAGGPLFSDTDELYYNDAVVVYPNPAKAANGFAIITDAKVFSGKTVISVYNMFGQLVVRENANADAGEVLINSGNFTSGSYFVHLINAEGKQAVKQIIIE
ncbi:MAG: sugar-binding protein [Deltaproteobacteria bacterium]